MSRPLRPDISVVIPAYNAERSLPELVQRLRAVFVNEGLSYEVIVVNDSSPDDTWRVIEELGAQDPRVVGIDLLSNHGQPTATMCGLAASRGRLVATMDDDLEHEPEQFPKLLAALDEHPDWDAVIGRWDREKRSWRGIGSWLHAAADRVAWGTPMDFRHTAYRLMRRPAVDALVAHRTASPVVGPMLYRVAANVHNVEITHGERSYGRSGFTFRDGVKRVLSNFAHGTTLPLQMISALGLIVAVSSVGLGVGILGRWVAGARGPQGWLSVFVATLFLSGLVLFAFGILGQYISLIVSEVRGSPRWSVRRTVTGEFEVEPEVARADREATAAMEADLSPLPGPPPPTPPQEPPAHIRAESR